MKNRTKLPNIFLGVILALTYLPIVIVVIYSFNSNRLAGIWESFSFSWYKSLFRNRQMKEALINSLVLATASSLTAAAVGTLAAVGMQRLHFRGQKAIEQVSMLPIMIPEIVLAMVFLAYFSRIQLPMGMLTLYISHSSFCIPYVYTNVKARLVGLNPSYVEAARDLGATEGRAFWDVTLPMVAPAIVSGTLLSFAMSMDDVIISVMLTGARVNTLPVLVHTQLKTEATPEINALCTLMLVATILIMGIAGLVERVSRKKQNVVKGDITV